MKIDRKSGIFKLIKNYVDELQMRKYFLGMLFGPKALLLAKKFDIDQKEFFPTLCPLCNGAKIQIPKK